MIEKLSGPFAFHIVRRLMLRPWTLNLSTLQPYLIIFFKLTRVRLKHVNCVTHSLFMREKLAEEAMISIFHSQHQLKDIFNSKHPHKLPQI